MGNVGNALGGSTGFGAGGKLTGSCVVAMGGAEVVVVRLGKRKEGLEVVATGSGSTMGSWHCPLMISLGGKQGGSGSVKTRIYSSFLVIISSLYRVEKTYLEKVSPMTM